MLKNKISYYFWRVAIGVSIGLILMFARSNAFALSFDMSYDGEYQVLASGNRKTFALSSSTGYVDFTFTSNYTNTNGYKYAVMNYSMTIQNGNASNDLQANNVIYRVSMIPNSGAWSTCELQTNFFVCPMIKDSTYNKIRVYYSYVPLINTNVTMNLNGYIQFYSSNSDLIVSSSSETSQNTKETAQNTKKIADEVSDNSDPSIDVSGMSGVQGLLPAGPLDSLLALPVNLLNILVNAISGTCEPFTFTFVFDSEWSLPCFDSFWNEVPTTLLLFMSDLPAVYIFIKWAKSIYKRVERAVSFESSVDDEWGGV